MNILRIEDYVIFFSFSLLFSNFHAIESDENQYFGILKNLCAIKENNSKCIYIMFGNSFRFDISIFKKV